jgi:putative effector of murein hydrolase
MVPKQVYERAAEEETIQLLLGRLFLAPILAIGGDTSYQNYLEDTVLLNKMMSFSL